MQKDVTLIVGAGGTGSYFIKNIIHYLKSIGNAENRILVIDGDIVESKNLLRQGFFKADLNKDKASALIDRYKILETDILKMEARMEFLSTAQQIVDLMSEDEYKNAETYTIVSCVDNNMARLRMHIGTYLLHEATGKEVRFIDSGNTEWTGQSLGTVLYPNRKTYLAGLYEALQGGQSSLNDFQLGQNASMNVVYNQFTSNDNWIADLTKGDFELSCDDVTVSNPQNVGTNMTASVVLLQLLDLIRTKTFKGGEIKFNAQTNNIYMVNEGVKEEVGYRERLGEIVEYFKSTVGMKEVFGNVGADNTTSTTPQEVVQEEEVQEEVQEEVNEEVNEEVQEEVQEEVNEEVNEEVQEVSTTKLKYAPTESLVREVLEEDISNIDKLEEEFDELISYLFS